MMIHHIIEFSSNNTYVYISKYIRQISYIIQNNPHIIIYPNKPMTSHPLITIPEIPNTICATVPYTLTPSPQHNLEEARSAYLPKWGGNQKIKTQIYRLSPTVGVSPHCKIL